MTEFTERGIGLVMKWMRFAVELFYVFFGRVNCIAFGMIAVSSLSLKALMVAGIPENAVGFAGRLQSLFTGMFFIGFLVMIVGFTIMRAHRSKVISAFGAVWWRGPREVTKVAKLGLDV